MAKLIRFNGSLTATVNGFGYVMWADTAIAMGGKQYFEINVSNTNQQIAGGLAYRPHGFNYVYYPVTGISTEHNISAGEVSWVAIHFNDVIHSSYAAIGPTTPASCVMGIAIDYQKNLIDFYKNGKLLYSTSSEVEGNNVLGVELIPFVSGSTNGATGTMVFNFGESPFMYQLPAGYTSVYQAMNGHELYLDDSKVWGMKNSVFAKLSDNFFALTDTEKEALFVSTNNEKASADDLSNLGKFKIINYHQNKSQAMGKMTAVPKNQLVLPKGLMSIDGFKSIDTVRLTNHINSNKVITNIKFNENGVNDFSGKTWVNSNVTFNENGKFGGRAAKFNGSSYLNGNQITDCMLDGDFTISCWYKSNEKTNTGPTLIGNWRTNTQDSVVIFLRNNIRGDGEMFFDIISEGTTYTGKLGAYLFDDNWHHLALVRKDNELKSYLDGNNLTTVSFPYKLTLDGSWIGCYPGESNLPQIYYVGNIDDFCIIKGEALWETNFMLPTDYLETKVPSCKLLFATDQITYQTYDFVTQKWQTVDHTNLADVAKLGIDAAQLPNIPRTAWDKLIKGRSGIGFAYLLSMEDTTDTCNIDKLELLVDMKGEWSKTDIK